MEWLDPELSLRQGFSSAGCLFNHILWSSSHRGEQCWRLRGRGRRSCGCGCVSHRGPGCLRRAVWVWVGTGSCGPHLLSVQPSVCAFFILTAGPPSSLPCPRPVVESRHNAGGRTGSLSIYEGRIVADRPPAVFWLLLMHCLSLCQ